MAKFKVGDTVRVRDDLVVGTKYDDVTCLPPMEELKGKTVTLIRVIAINKTCLVQEDCFGLMWTWDMFYPCVVKPAPEPEPEPKMCKMDRVFELPAHCIECPIPMRICGVSNMLISGTRRPDECPLIEVDEQEAKS
jgi:hypothetical protein